MNCVAASVLLLMAPRTLARPAALAPAPGPSGEYQLEAGDDYSWATGQGESLNTDFILDMEAASANGNPVSLIWYGDSILQCLRFEQGTCSGTIEAARQRFGRFNSLVAAVGNEDTRRAMGRILDGVVPEPSNLGNTTVAVVLLGANEVAGKNAEDVADRVAEMAYYLLDLDPGMQVMPLALLPSTGSDFLLKNSQKYLPGQEFQDRLQELAQENDRIHYMECTPHFLEAGTPEDNPKVNSSLIPDGVHLSAAGVQALGDCLEPTLSQLLAAVAEHNAGQEPPVLNVRTGMPSAVTAAGRR